MSDKNKFIKRVRRAYLSIKSWANSDAFAPRPPMPSLVAILRKLLERIKRWG